MAERPQIPVSPAKTKLVQTLALSASFYVAWIGCILASFRSLPSAYALAATLPFVFISVWFERRIHEPIGRRLWAVGLITILGVIQDSMLISLHLLELSPGQTWEFSSIQITPFWYVCIWLQLALSVLVWARWALPSYAWAAMGAVGGPLSFIAAEKMGAIHIHMPMEALGLLWALVIPLQIGLTQKLVKTQN